MNNLFFFHFNITGGQNGSILDQLNTTKLEDLYFSKSFKDGEKQLRSLVFGPAYHTIAIYSGILYDGQNWVHAVTNQIASHITWCPRNPDGNFPNPQAKNPLF